MDEHNDKSSSEKKDGTSRWSRTGYFINVEHDLEQGRVTKPQTTGRSVTQPIIQKSLERDVAMALAKFQEASKAEDAAEKTLERKKNLSISFQ